MWAEMDPPGLVYVHGDPDQPTPSVSDHRMLREMPPEAVEAILAWRISRTVPITFSFAMNDYSFELLSDQPIPVDDGNAYELFSTENLFTDIQRSVNSTEMAKRKFRDIAVIGGGEPASVALHAKAGFRHAGRMERVGEKFGRLLDTVYMQRTLEEQR